MDRRPRGRRGLYPCRGVQGAVAIVNGMKFVKRSSVDLLFGPERLWHWNCQGLLCASEVQRHGDC